MIILSDTHILSSFAAASAFPRLLQLFRGVNIYISPAVQQELQAGLARGKTYLAPILAMKELRLLWLRRVITIFLLIYTPLPPNAIKNDFGFVSALAAMPLS